MGPKSHLSDEQLAKLDDEELFAVLCIKDIMHQPYRKVTLEECAGAQDHMNDDKQTKFQAVLENIKCYLTKLVYTLIPGSV